MMRWTILPLLALLVGCGPETRSYNVTVQNNATEPMTLWLTKSGSPLEKNWISPEDLAVLRMDKGSKLPGTVIPVGERRGIGPIAGKFAGGSQAVLRVYRGQRKFDELLSMNADSPNRTDVQLVPGNNEILIDARGVATRK